MSDSKWQQYDIEVKLMNILRETPDEAGGHHFGRPFLTAYQIAIEFAQRHPEVVTALGHPVGGQGIGVHYSLASYLAQQLSVRIRDGLIPVEGGFLSNKHLHAIAFDHNDELIISSLTNTQFTLSMYRLREA
ncbi:MAG: hypothetical protein KJ069_22855 [Anaerolineae bacterium]|nr:hypothetical protein [Anaerolineae bacterium]